MIRIIEFYQGTLDAVMDRLWQPVRDGRILRH